MARAAKRTREGRKDPRVALAQQERLRPVLGPLGRIVEGRGIPDDFEHELWQLDGMRCRARAAGLERTGLRVRDVAAVRRAVEIHAIPAAAWMRSSGQRICPSEEHRVMVIKQLGWSPR